MDEKVIVVGKRWRFEIIMVILIIYFFVTMKYNNIIDRRFPFWFFAIDITLALVGFVIAVYLFLNIFVKLTVTNEKITGVAPFFKKVALPIDSVSSISRSLFGGIGFATSSGIIKFNLIKNADEVYKAVSDLIAERQNKKNTASNSQNNEINIADELKKYKDLLDSGAISKEEFDSMKQKLLNK